MIISEKQITLLITLVQEARLQLTLARVITPTLGENFMEISAKILNEINNQQSEELKVIE